MRGDHVSDGDGRANFARRFLATVTALYPYGRYSTPLASSFEDYNRKIASTHVSGYRVVNGPHELLRDLIEKGGYNV